MLVLISRGNARVLQAADAISTRNSPRVCSACFEHLWSSFYSDV